LAYLEQAREGVFVSVRLQPKAGKTELAGVTDEYLKVKVTAAPVDGAANDACRTLFAKAFGIAKGRIQIISGAKSRQKRILLAGLDEKAVASRIAELLQH
jgi:uncharacterized protein (TIGR00251 family)